MKDHIDALLETPSGFALFSINEDVLEKADVIWVHFRDAAAAECAMSILGYVKIDDKNSAWEGKTHASKNLLGLVARFCNDRNQLYVETANLALNINQKLEVNCYYDKNVIEELMWGIKNVLHEFIPEEKDNITPAYCLPLSNGLQNFLKLYCINLPALSLNKDFISKLGFLASLDLSMEVVPKKLREYDEFVADIGKFIEDDLLYAKVLSNILVPEWAPRYDFSEMFSQDLASLIEEANKSATWHRENKLSLNDRSIIMGGLNHLLAVPEHRDKVITCVKQLESKLLKKIEIIDDPLGESKSSSPIYTIEGEEKETELEENK